MKGGVVLFFCGGAHPSPPKGREPDTHPRPLPKGGGKGQAPTRSGGYAIRLNSLRPEGGGDISAQVLRIKNPDTRLRRITYPPEHGGRVRGGISPLPWGGDGGGYQLRRIAYPPEHGDMSGAGYSPSLGEGTGVGPQLRRITYPPEH